MKKYEDQIIKTVEDWQKEEIEEARRIDTLLNDIKKEQTKEFNEDLDFIITDSNEYGHTWNYNIIDKPIGEYHDDSELPTIKGTWTEQTTNGGYTGDEFAGTICIKLEENKYLLFHYSC